MAKFYGKIGYGHNKETFQGSGIYKEVVTEKTYSGDVLSLSRRTSAGDTLNDNIMVSNVISIVSDPFANDNFYAILWVDYMGSKWKISNVGVQYPRLLLTLGGVYNG